MVGVSGLQGFVVRDFSRFWRIREVPKLQGTIQDTVSP